MQNLRNIHFRQQGDATSKKTEMRKIEKFSGIQKIFLVLVSKCYVWQGRRDYPDSAKFHKNRQKAPKMLKKSIFGA